MSVSNDPFIFFGYVLEGEQLSKAAADQLNELLEAELGSYTDGRMRKLHVRVESFGNYEREEGTFSAIVGPAHCSYDVVSMVPDELFVVTDEMRQMLARSRDICKRDTTTETPHWWVGYTRL